MIARTIRPLTSAAVLFTVVSIGPSVWADAAEDAKPYSINNGVVDPYTFTGYLRWTRDGLRRQHTIAAWRSGHWRGRGQWWRW